MDEYVCRDTGENVGQVTDEQICESTGVHIYRVTC